MGEGSNMLQNIKQITSLEPNVQLASNPATLLFSSLSIIKPNHHETFEDPILQRITSNQPHRVHLEFHLEGLWGSALVYLEVLDRFLLFRMQKCGLVSIFFLLGRFPPPICWKILSFPYMVVAYKVIRLFTHFDYNYKIACDVIASWVVFKWINFSVR